MRERRPRGGRAAAAAAAEGTTRPRCTPPTLPQLARPAPSAAPIARWRLRPLRAAATPGRRLHGRLDGRAAAVLQRPCETRQRGKRGAVSRGRRGLDGRAAGRQRRRHQTTLTAARVPARTCRCSFLHAARTCQSRPRRAAERPALAAMAAATTPRTRAVGATQSAVAAARVEVPASTDASRLARGGRLGRGLMGHQVRAAAEAAHLPRC